MTYRRRVLVALALALAAAPCTAQRGNSGVQLRYLGTAGWEIANGTTVVLIDPYLSRVNQITPNDTVLAADTRPFFGSDSIARSDTATIDAHIKRANFILITHTHSDHVLDVPYIAAKTGATIIGTESTYNFARAHGIPADKIFLVRGGEDYEFGSIAIKVIPSLHGVLRRAPYLVRNPNATLPPNVFPRDAKPPFKMGELRIEGGTLAYLIRIGGRQILAFGSMNYIEREVEGLRPDVALIGAMPERREIYDYTARLLHVLGDPPMVLPTHWDRFNVTYEVSQEPAIKRLQTFIAEVKAASPKTKIVVPKYFEPVIVP